MKIIDISREILSCEIYPGDPKPFLQRISSADENGGYNIGSLTVGLHTGTHIDAPKHVFPDGDSIDMIDERIFAGECRVCRAKNEIITGDDIDKLHLRGEYRRVIFRTDGKAHLSKSAAYCLIDEGVKLVGIDDITIGTPTEDYEVHRILLGAGCMILEGLDLRDVEPQNYDLWCMPLKLAGAEASPCRAFLTYRNL